MPECDNCGRRIKAGKTAHPVYTAPAQPAFDGDRAIGYIDSDGRYALGRPDAFEIWCESCVRLMRHDLTSRAIGR